MEQNDQRQWIRVSCAALCRIEHAGRGFLLLLNQNRREKGIYQLSPIGGALHYENEDLPARFNAHPENTVDPELRLMLPVDNLPAFCRWFYSEQDRETSPYRELYEELVIESRLLPALSPDDVTCKRLWTVESEQFTSRKGQTGILTHYFLEVYAIGFTSTPVLAQLISAPRAAGAMWLNAEQLASEKPVTMFIDGEERQVRVRGKMLIEPPDSAATPPDASRPA